MGHNKFYIINDMFGCFDQMKASPIYTPHFLNDLLESTRSNDYNYASRIFYTNIQKLTTLQILLDYHIQVCINQICSNL